MFPHLAGEALRTYIFNVMIAKLYHIYADLARSRSSVEADMAHVLSQQCPFSEVATNVHGTLPRDQVDSRAIVEI
jgi:hypothetical protein